MKRRFGYPPMSFACRSCSKARLFSAASTLKSRMIALRSRHFRKRAPDLRNSARLNTIPPCKTCSSRKSRTGWAGEERAQAKCFGVARMLKPLREAEAVYDEGRVVDSRALSEITTVTLTEAVITEYLLGTSCFSPHAELYLLLARGYLWLP